MYKKIITDKFLSDKPKDYVISESEQQLIDLTDDAIQGLLDDQKYISDNYKRVLDQNLNLEEMVDELKDQIKELKQEIKQLNY